MSIVMRKESLTLKIEVQVTLELTGLLKATQMKRVGCSIYSRLFLNEKLLNWMGRSNVDFNYAGRLMWSWREKPNFLIFITANGSHDVVVPMRKGFSVD